MSFSAELKDFLGGFKGGWKLAGEAEDREIKRETNEIRKDLAAERIATSKAARDETEGARAAYRGDGKDVERFDSVPMGKTQEEFINKITPLAVQAEKDTGIDRRVIIAQAAHESGWGKHAPGNNLFGIKGGQGAPLETTEVVNGRPVKVMDRFRSYASPADSVADYARFINTNKRYAPVKGAQGWEAQIDALGRSGYATDPAYAAKLKSIARGIKTADAEFGIPTQGVDLEEERPVVFAASGGLIEDDYSGDDESGGSNPAVRDAVEGKDVDDDLGMDMAYDPQVPRIMAGASEMANVALEDISRRVSPRAGVGEVAPDNQQGLQALAHNAGAATPREVEALRKVGDPQGKLPSKQLAAIAGFHRMYEYYTQRGDAPKAQNAARAMLMYSKQAAQMAGTTMQAALDDGNLEGAAKIAEKAYNENLLDGQRMEVTGKGKNGMKFKMYDEETGEMTNQGEATMDQMVKLATGLQNGTEWFRASNVLAQKRVDKTAQRIEGRRQALQEFNEAAGEGGDEGDYRSTLSPEAQAKFDKMHPDEQKQFRARFDGQRREAFKNERFTERRLDQREREDYRRRFQMFDTARRQGNWEQQREQVMDASDRRLALIERDLSDRMIRHDESAEARQRRYDQIDERILKKAATQGVRLTAAERADQAIDQGAAGELRQGINVGESEGRIAGELGSKADTELTPEDADMAAGIRGQERAAISVGAAFDKKANDRDNKFDPSVVPTIRTTVGETMKAAAAGKKVPEQAQRLVTDMATDFTRGSDMDPERAAQVAYEALDPKVPVQVNPKDGSVRIGKERPVFMKRHNYLTLMQMRGKQLTSGGKEGPPEPVVKKGQNRAFGGLFDLPAMSTRPSMSPYSQGVPITPGKSSSHLPPAGVDLTSATTSKYDIDEKRKKAESRRGVNRVY